VDLNVLRTHDEKASNFVEDLKIRVVTEKRKLKITTESGRCLLRMKRPL